MSERRMFHADNNKRWDNPHPETFPLPRGQYRNHVALGVIRETAAGESRVALAPDAVQRFTSRGELVLVQRGAGLGAGFTDSRYADAGADVVDDHAELFARSDIIAWVKPPNYNLLPLPLRSGAVLTGFQNPLKRRGDIAALRERGVRSVAFEFVPAGAPHLLDALSRMSRIAGEVAFLQARRLLSAAPARVLVLGCGAAGLAASRAAAAAGVTDITVLARRPAQRSAALAAGAATFLLNTDASVLSSYLATWTPNLIVCAAIDRGHPAPLLLGPDELALLSPGSVIVDLTAKAGGNCTMTVSDRTLTLPGGVIITHRANYPAQRPRTATRAYSIAMAAMIRYLLAGPPHFDNCLPGPPAHERLAHAVPWSRCYIVSHQWPRPGSTGKGTAVPVTMLPEPAKTSPLQLLTAHSEERKRELRQLVGASSFPGTGTSQYAGIIDAYHGETGLPLAPPARSALDEAWRELVDAQLPADYRDEQLYDKRQPLILRELAAAKLFRRLSAPLPEVPGVQVAPAEVLVTPYSSTILLEEALATIARPGGIIICPEGFYKSNSLHVEKHGLRIVSCPATPGESFRIDPATLAAWLHDPALRPNLCGVLLTMPGNPVVADYSLAELSEIARVLTSSGLPVICDMAFDQLVDGHVPIAALTVNGTRLYDQVLTITGNSKGYNAFGPCKLGAACTGNTVWLDRIRARLTTAFQRESTHLVRAVLEHTNDAYLASNRALLRTHLQHARARIAAINTRLGTTIFQVLGSPRGMFLSVTVDRALLRRAQVRTATELEDLLLAAGGVDAVGLERTGSARLGVRLNVLAPRKQPGQEQTRLQKPAAAQLGDELFDRLERLAANLQAGLTYPRALADRGLPTRRKVKLVAGVIRETVPGERRVALTPDDVERLTAAGMHVVLEQGAGSGAGYSDATYALAGAAIVQDASWVFERSDVVAWVKPPVYPLDAVQPGQLLVGFQDPVERQAEIAQLRGAGVHSVAFELVQSGSETRRIDALSRISRIAGAVAFRQGSRLLLQAIPRRVLVLGCGQAGQAVARAARTLYPTVIGNRAEQARNVGQGSRFVLNTGSDRHTILEQIATQQPDLVLCAAARRGARAPQLIDQEALSLLRPGTVVVDLVAKAGGNCIATQPETTRQLDNGVVVTHQSNYSAVRPRTASRAYGGAAAAMISRIAANRRYGSYVA